MKVQVELLPSKESKSIELEVGSTGMNLVRALGLSPDVHILFRGDRPIPIDDEIREGESIKVVNVVSGG